MAKKKCNKCGCEKELSEFPKGRGAKCKECKRPEWRKKDAKRKDYHYEYNKNSYKEKRDIILAKRRIWDEKNKERNKENAKTWEANNKDYRKAKRNNRRKTDVQFRIAERLRAQMRGAIKGKKSAKTMELLGCDIEFFMEYIASLFLPGMTWDNYGYYTWHLEHRIPVKAFDLTNPEHQKRCYHFTNYRPMWGLENLQKNRFFDEKQLELWLNTPIEKLHELVDYDFKTNINEFTDANSTERREAEAV